MFDWFGDDNGEEEDPAAERRKEEIQEILDSYEQRVDAVDVDSKDRVTSREYQEYKEAEKAHERKTWYEKLVRYLSPFTFEFSDFTREHRQALELLHYDINPEQIAPAALITTLMAVMLVLPVFLVPVPVIFKILALAVPPTIFYYVLKYPSLQARKRVVKSSEELILTVLYMVIYMRSTPSLEGAVSFAVRHLDGPVSTDLQLILWQVDMRQYSTVRDGLKDYMGRWRPYNKGFVQSLNLIMSATEEGNRERRNKILTEAVDVLLDFTRDQMDEFASNLRVPVMVLYGIGILLPVLGVILFPLIATFMGGGGTAVYLIFLYNILIPVIVFLLMRNLLLDRPLSAASKTGRLEDINPGNIGIEIGGRTFTVSALVVAAPLFLLFMAWPAPHFYEVLFQGGSFPIDPSTVTLLRELMPIMAISVPVGMYLLVGWQDVVEKQVTVRQIEEEFPEALFELGNALSRGKPVELAVSDVVTSHQNLDISSFFEQVATNIRDYGMTFGEAIFDREQGAIQRYPSEMMRTVMEVIAESTEKGTEVASQSMRSISDYLKNIQETQKTLEEAVDDTMSSLKFLAFVLAPVIAGVAVGMGSVISIALFSIGQVSNQTQVDSGATTGGAPGGDLLGSDAGIGAVLDLESIIPPGLLQLIIGIYLIQISFLVGTLLVRVKEGENKPKRNTTIGKILISSTFLYAITVLTLVIVFGGILKGALGL